MNRDESTSRPAGPLLNDAHVSSAPGAQDGSVALDRDPVEVLADEFIARYRRGERPTIDEYVRNYPDVAESIRNLFPTIAAMEQLKVRKEKDLDRAAPSGWAKIERLGDLRILGEIGRGGMGIVYLAEQESLGRQVAVKVLPKQSLLDEKRLRRFEREAKTAARLHHTNIVPILGVGEHDGYHYYVMQYIRGVGLDEIIGKLMQLDHGAASPTDAVERRAVSAAAPREDEVASVARALLQGQFHAANLSGSTSRVSVSASESTNAPSASKKDSASGIRVATSSSDTANVDASSRPTDAEVTSQRPAAVEPDGSARFGNRYWHGVTRIGLQVADALRYAHAQGTLHRDVKPANLLLDAHGVVWVADFGLAKAMEHDNVSHTGDIVGTLRYMAPEQIHGTADARGDIYSLGLTLYELLTLRPAHDDSQRKQALVHGGSTTEPPPPRRLNPSIPRDLETVVLKSMAEDPAERYQTADDLAADLQCVLEDRPIRARRATSAERLWRWCRRNRAVASLSAVALALLVSVAVVASVGYVRESAQRQKLEATVEIAVDALDKVYERFAPDRTTATAQLTVEGVEGEEIEVPIQPVLSPETASLLEDLLPLYDRLAMQGSDGQALLEESAKANRRVGDIQQRLGQSAHAEQAYQRAIRKYQQLDDRSADPWRYQMEIARIYNELANVCLSTFQWDQSRKWRLDALNVLRSSSTDEDAPAEARYELARTFYYLGRRDRRGGPPRRGGGERGPRRQRPDRPPDSPPSERRDRRGPEPSDTRDRRQGETGENYLQNAVTLLNQLHEEHPAVPEYRHLLALCYRDMSRRDRNREAGGVDTVDKATKLLEALVDDFPDVPDYRHDLSETYAMIDLRRIGDEDELQPVEQQLLKASSICEQLVRDHPNIPSYARTQIDINEKLAMVLFRAGRQGDAEQDIKHAIELQSSLVRRFPDVRPYSFKLAMLEEMLANVLYSREQFTEAETILEASIKRLQLLLDHEPDMLFAQGSAEWTPNTFLHAMLANRYGRLSEIFQRLNDADRAEDSKRLARQHWEHLPEGRRGPRRGRWEGSRRRSSRGPRPEASDAPQPTEPAAESAQ